MIDLKADEGKALLHRLLARADVLVENYRPGTLEKMGLGWHDLHARYPRLVWVSVSGYGRSGPRANAPAYDSMIQAYTGIMGITGEADRGPVRCGGSPIDIATAYLAWGSIMTGLHALHMMVGLGVMTWLAVQLGRRRLDAEVDQLGLRLRARQDLPDLLQRQVAALGEFHRVAVRRRPFGAEVVGRAQHGAEMEAVR